MELVENAVFGGSPVRMLRSSDAEAGYLAIEKESSCEEKFREAERKINWIKVLSKAINSRTSSWYPIGFRPVVNTNKYSPAEWGNASDELRIAVMQAFEQTKLIEPLLSGKYSVALLRDEIGEKKCDECARDGV